LKALAAEPTESLFSSDYQQKHRLRTLSSIQNALKKLESLDYIEKDFEGVYRLTDPIFALWVNSKNSDPLTSGTITIQEEKSRSIGQTRKEENVENALKRGYSEITGYRSEEAVEIKAELPEPGNIDTNKPGVYLFFSYAHDDSAVKENFFDKIRARLKTSKEFRFSFSSDRDILTGERWHDEIQEMIKRCDFGLLLLSTNFLGSDYIEKHELPNLLDKCLPVALDILDLKNQNLKGLNEKQIFFFNGNRSFNEVKENNRTRFINKLAADIENRVSKQRSTAISTEKSGPISCDPINNLSERLLKYKEPNYRHEKFVPGDGVLSQISHNPDDSKRGDTVIALDYIKSWALDSDVPYFALLGDFGTGKTFTCRMLTRELLALHAKEPDTCPLCIYIDLRMVATRVGAEKKTPKLTDILQDAIENTKDPLDRSIVTPQDIIQLVRQNKALIIYDGLDEKTVHFTPEETSRFVSELWSIREIKDKKSEDHQGKVLISCRTHYFRDIFEQNSLFLGRDREGRSSSEYRSCTLLPFDDSQIRKYLKKNVGCDDEEIERIIGLFEEVHNLKELAGRPYALSLIIEFIPDLERLQQEGKAINTARLYELTIENWLRRDEGKHEFSVLHKKKLMKALAFELHRRSGGGISAEELEEWLDTWLYHHPVIKDAYSNMNRETLKKDLRTATFIIREQDKEFSFAHTSLQEYFLAGYLLDAFSSPNTQDETLAIPLPSNETLNFAAEMLALDERLLASSIKTIEKILADSYQKEVSELSLALWLKLHERGMKEPNPGTVHLEHAELSGWRISNLNLSNACFDHATLRGTQFDHTILTKSMFRKSCIINAEFLSCNATGADFTSINGIGSIWRNTNIQNSNWHLAELRLASFVFCNNVGSRNLPSENEFVTASCTGIENTTLMDNVTIKIYNGHTTYVSGCAFSPNGKSIVSAARDNTLKLWDATSGICTFTFSGHKNVVSACIFSFDGLGILSASWDCTLKLWNPSSDDCIRTFTGHNDAVNDGAFSSDGSRILSASKDKTLKIWDTPSGNCIRTLSGHTAAVTACAFSSDGNIILSASEDKTLKIWDTSSGNCIRTLSGHTAAVTACAFSSDGKTILSASWDCTLKLWNVTSGNCILNFIGHKAPINDCAFNFDGNTILSASEDKTLKLWNSSSGICICTLSGHTAAVSACGLSADEKTILSASFDSTLKLWNATSGNCIRTLSGHSIALCECAFSSDGSHILSTSWDCSLKLWNASSGNCIRIFSGHSAAVSACAFSPNGKTILSASLDGTLKLWNVTSGDCIRTFSGHTGSITACAFNFDGSSILSSSRDRTIKLWDTYSGICIRTFRGHKNAVYGCTFSNDGKTILSASWDCTLKLWNVTSGNCILNFIGHKEPINDCAFNFDGSSILSASQDNTLKLWDASSSACILTLSGHKSAVIGCAFNSNGSQLLSSSWDNTLKLWDGTSGKCINTFSGHTHPVHAGSFSYDGKNILSASYDGTLKLWDGTSGNCIMTMANLPHNETAAWDGNSKHLLSASENAWRWIGLSSGLRRLPIELLNTNET
ncbi:MAG: TIR domain-containing protein, partial [Chlorobiaceae bacterium]|nr:TIR domain-containing protein [Chlorobiaceae bacterium]